MRRLLSTPVVLLLACAAAPGCADTGKGDDSGGADSDTSGDSGGDTGEAARTYDNCAPTVGADVPTFFQRYFQCTDLSMDGGDVVMATQSLPPYDTYYYGPDSPNAAVWDDQGGTTAPNPHFLTAQTVLIKVPGAPVAKGLSIDTSLVDLQAGTSSEEFPGGPVGVAPDSVAAFNATAAPGDDILEEQYTFDEWGAHPDQRGTYHHHQANRGALSALLHAGIITTDIPGAAEVEVYGVMCDGTILLGCTELDGGDVAAGEIDAQNGHVGDIVDRDGAVYFTGRYHTHLCEALGHHGLAPEIQYYTACGSAPPA